MLTTVRVKTQFPGIHSWPDAKDEVKFLSNEHRHLFYVELEVITNLDEKDNREVEFFILKRDLEGVINKLYPFEKDMIYRPLGNRSCEMIAKEILEYLQKNTNYIPYKISVSEDNESTSTIYNLPFKV